MLGEGCKFSQQINPFKTFFSPHFNLERCSNSNFLFLFFAAGEETTNRVGQFLGETVKREGSSSPHILN